MKHWILSACLGLFLLEAFSVFPSRLSTQPNSDLPFAVSGLINVPLTTTNSPEDISELTQLAKENGHSFVVFSEYNSTQGRSLHLENNYDGIDAFVELETSTPSGDLLLFYTHTSFAQASSSELSKIAYERFLGGQRPAGLFVSVSHPSHIKKPWTQLDLFPDGLELINFDGLFWRKLYSNPLDFLGLTLLYPLNPFIAALRMMQPYPKDLANWDNMNTLDPSHFGILSSQFKQRIHIPWLDLSWPSHRELFRLGSNILLLKEQLSSEFSIRKKQIYSAIKEGRLAMVFQAIHPFAGNDFFLKCPQGNFRSGDSFKGDSRSCEFVVKTPKSLPYSAKIRLLRNGELFKEIYSSESEVHVPISESGQFRVEVMVRPHTAFWILLRKWVPYVLYNPIFLRQP